MASDPPGDIGFMRRAMALAREGDRKPGANPIGCVIVLDGAIIGEGYNEVDVRHDPTSHAEIVAMRRAGEKLRQSEFRGATLYSTLQPCGMCTMASIWAKIGRIVYGAERDQVHPMYFEDRPSTPWISCATRSATIFPSAAGCLPTSARRSMWVPTRRCRRTSSLTADLSEPGWPMHSAIEIDIDIDNFQSDLVVSTG